MKQPDNTAAKGFVVDEGSRVARELIARLRDAGVSEPAQCVAVLEGTKELANAVGAMARYLRREAIDERALARLMLAFTGDILESGWRVEDVVGPEAIHDAKVDLDRSRKAGGPC